ncbi:MAG: TIGR04076 family protein [Actinobacteria bacterium]|nr:TIGR04076 family protein [Actinomycetota bacterium]
MKKLIIEVKEINGNCPVYKVGDRIVLDDGYKVNLTQTSAICMHSLASIMPYYVALSNGISPSILGLTKKNANDSAFVQCLDPCEYTGGGTVIFEVKVF